MLSPDSKLKLYEFVEGADATAGVPTAGLELFHKRGIYYSGVVEVCSKQEDKISALLAHVCSTIYRSLVPRIISPNGVFIS